jgi:hypothetical protein
MPMDENPYRAPQSATLAKPPSAPPKSKRALLAFTVKFILLQYASAGVYVAIAGLVWGIIKVIKFLD